MAKKSKGKAPGATATTQAPAAQSKKDRKREAREQRKATAK